MSIAAFAISEAAASATEQSQTLTKTSASRRVVAVVDADAVPKRAR